MDGEINRPKRTKKVRSDTDFLLHNSDSDLGQINLRVSAPAGWLCMDFDVGLRAGYCELSGV